MKFAQLTTLSPVKVFESRLIRPHHAPHYAGYPRFSDEERRGWPDISVLKGANGYARP
jgi:hypothetical protein